MYYLKIRELQPPKEFLNAQGGWRSSQDSKIRARYHFKGSFQERIEAIKKIGQIKELLDFLKVFPLNATISISVENGEGKIQGVVETYGTAVMPEFQLIWYELSNLFLALVN